MSALQNLIQANEQAENEEAGRMKTIDERVDELMATLPYRSSDDDFRIRKAFALHLKEVARDQRDASVLAIGAIEPDGNGHIHPNAACRAALNAEIAKG